ncbi:putative ribonuclease H-like domain-containing protein, partial [Tanacetum coccineum]
IDDLYYFKIVEQNVKKSVGASTGNQNMAFMSAPSTSSTNDEVSTASTHVNTVSTNVNTVSTQYSTASLSDTTVYAFLVNYLTGSQLVHEDLEQIHEDDLEEMDLKWQLALLSIRAKKYYQRTGKKITINRSDIAGYDKLKVECFNYYKMGHFARECRNPRSQESMPRNYDHGSRNQESSRRIVNLEETSSKAMLAIDGVGFDWSDMAEEQIQTNMALMAFLDSEFEKVKHEKEGIEFKIEKFDNALKSLDMLLGSQITDKTKKGLGYSVVPLPHPLIYNRPTKLDLSYSGLDEFKEPEFKGYGPRNDNQESNINCDKKSNNSEENTDDSLVKEQVSEDDNSSVESLLKVDKETVFHTAKKVESVKPKDNEKPVRKSVRYAEMYRSQKPRGNQRNWNGQKSSQLGSGFVMYNKACFCCGNFNHMQKNCPYHQRKRMVTGNDYNRVDYDYYAKTLHLSTHRSMPPRAVLLKIGLTPVNTARPIYTAHPKPTIHSARPMTHFSKQAQSTVQRPFYKKTALTNKYFNQKVNTVRPTVVNTARPYTATVNTVRAYRVNVVKTSACWVWRPIRPDGASLVFKRHNYIDARGRSKQGKPQMNDKGFVDSGCSRHMTGNIAYLSDFKEFDGDYVTFGGGVYGGKISSKSTLKTDNIDFEDVYFVSELKFNLSSVSQMCDKKNYVLFTDSKCLVLSPNFKLSDKSQILLKIPRKDNMYSFDMKNIVPKEGLTCFFAKDTLDESILWHRMLGHINFKNINKLVKENLVRGLPLKRFENDQTRVACLKGKQHRASCKSKVLNPITKPLFTWVFFLTTKDETSEILKNFIKEIENLVDKKVKIIKSDNGTEFKNKVMDDFCREKDIRREYSVARTPQQNRIAERRNRTLVETARTMLANSKLPTTFWAETVSTACYVQNRVLLVKRHNKTPYELFRGFKPALSFMRPFGCHVTILNTLDHLGKFDGKSDEGFFVGYSLSSKAFRVYNTRTRKVEENLHIGFLENKPMLEGNGPKWLFDIDSLAQSMNYVPDDANKEPQHSGDPGKKIDEGVSNASGVDDEDSPESSTLNINTAEPSVNTGRPRVNTASANFNPGSLNFNTVSRTVITTSHKEVILLDYNVNIASPEVNTGRFILNTVDPSVNNASSSDPDSPKDMFTMGASHTLEDTYEEPKRVSKALSDSAWVEAMQEELLQFKLQKVWVLVDLPKGKRAIGTKWIFKNKTDERGIVIKNKARLVAQGHTQEEGIDYDEVFALVARIEAIRLFLAYSSFMGFIVYQMYVKSAFLYGQIEKEVYVCQPPGCEDPYYPDKVYKVVKALYGLHQAPRAWYETLANYLLGNGFQRGKIDQTLFIKKQKGDILLVQVYVDDIIFGSTKKETCTEFEKLMKDKFQMSSIGELTFFLGLQVKQKEDGIFISQDKYIAKILRKFNYTDMKSASTTIDLEKPLVMDKDVDDVDVHLYRSMIGSLMYLTTSRPDIMFAVCACAKFQVTPKTSHLLAVKRIFRYLKGKPTLSHWYPRDSPFEVVAYSDSDYAGATQDMKSTTGGCQFLGNRLIS